MTMSKRISLGILLTNWIVGLFFILFFPPSVDAAPSIDHKSHFQVSQGLVSDSGNLPDKPSLELDLKFFVSSSGLKSLPTYSTSTVLGFLFSEYGSVPLFDIKQTFIHFFFTW